MDFISHIIIGVLAIMALVGWANSDDAEFMSDDEAWENNSVNKMSCAYEE